MKPEDIYQFRDQTWGDSGMLPAYPKPGQLKQPVEPVKVFADGREVCNDKTVEGRAEYRRRRRVAFEEQKGICPLCRKRLLWSEATTDHKRPRGMGSGARDDRQSNIAAVHGLCNSMRGSKRTGYEEDRER